ncbi:hypothetical protein CTEN210_04071 [Chaetoceros tenuissimus]|uniref:Ankyrin repeat-containing domain n=1 Tax=Chaetoceros tenuissimus TaxID=426638 RepID=A0AAD3H278_9STRA|nr:hypothetical protein CTEN210_04071 [Chaetoceros tenuissimus]
MSNKRMKISHVNLREGEELSASFEDLQNENDVMNVIFSFIPGSYVTIGCVSKQFYSDYSTRGIHESAAFNSADSLLKIGKNRRTTADSVSNDIELTEYCFINSAPEEFMMKVCQKAALKGRTDILECAKIFGVNFTLVIWIDLLILKLAEEGNLEMLQYLSTHFDEEAWGKVSFRAAQNDHVHIMKWCANHIKDRVYRTLIREEIEVCEAYEHVLAGMEAPRVTKELRKKAAEHGNIQVLEYCHRNHLQFETFLWQCQHNFNGGLCNTSVINKDKEQALKTLKWLRRHGCPWGEGFCSYVARFDNLEALKLARNEACPWDVGTLREAVKRGNIPMIKYCLQNECPMDETVCTSAMSIKDHNVALEVLKLLRKHSCPWNLRTCARAISGGHFEAMLWAMRNGCPWTDDTFASCVEEGNVSVIEEVLQDEVLHGSMSVQTTGVVEMAPAVVRAIDNRIFQSTNDHCIIEKLKLLRKYGYKWNENTSAEAAKRGQLRVLQWLQYLGCPMDTKTCAGAVQAGEIDILKYAHKVAGCGLSKEAYAFCFDWLGLDNNYASIPTSVRDSHVKILKYLEENKCPRPAKSDWNIHIQDTIYFSD